MSSPKILTFNEQIQFNLMDKFMRGKGTAKWSCEVAGSELDHRVAFHSLLHAATQHRKSHLKASPGGSCGGVGGCWATPSTVSPQAPPASCPSPASGDGSLGAPSSPPVSAVFAATYSCKGGVLTRANPYQQVVPTAGGRERPGPYSADCLTSLLVCSLTPGNGSSGLWSLFCTASGPGGKG